LTRIGLLVSQDGENRPALRPGGAAYITPDPRHSREKAMLSRRDVVAGAAISAACSILPARAQQKSSAPFRILHARAGAASAGAGGPLFGYDGTVPGPVLRARQGDELRVRLFNELAEPTSVHWHGIRLPNAMDGVSDLTQPPVAPGASFDYSFRPPDAGTFWYHAHSPRQADGGLYGALLVEEPEPVDADRDIVLLLGTSDAAQTHALTLVNGIIQPDIPVQAGERVRLRLINATGARGLSPKIQGHTPWVMAIDGQPLEPFLPHEGRVGLAPGSRVDLFLDASAAAGAIIPIVSGIRDEAPIARLVYQTGGTTSRRLGSQPRPLPNNALPARIDLKNALRAEMRIGVAAGQNAVPIFSVRRGRPVSLGLQNPSGHPHVVHLHGHHFRLLDRLDDGWKPYWLDTLVVGELGERIAFVADNPGKWLIESRMLDRSDSGAAVWFAVT
jgi:FtsP/CotA-like multicopper oxidase with cupredoxin domain